MTINYDAIPKCPICEKRLLLHWRQRNIGCCYPCSRRKLPSYCDQCNWRGRAAINGQCPQCQAWGRLHLEISP